MRAGVTGVRGACFRAGPTTTVRGGVVAVGEGIPGFRTFPGFDGRCFTRAITRAASEVPVAFLSFRGFHTSLVRGNSAPAAAVPSAEIRRRIFTPSPARAPVHRGHVVKVVVSVAVADILLGGRGPRVGAASEVRRAAAG